MHNHNIYVRMMVNDVKYKEFRGDHARTICNEVEQVYRGLNSAAGSLTFKIKCRYPSDEDLIQSYLNDLIDEIVHDTQIGAL